MTIEATNTISIAEDALRLTLANAAAVQNWMGAANADAALARIYVDALPPAAGGLESYTLAELQSYRPFMVVSTLEDGGYAAQQDASWPCFEESGSLEVFMSDDVSPAVTTDQAAVMRTWKNIVGSVIDALKAASGAEGRLATTGVRLVEYGRSHPDVYESKGDSVFARLHVDWKG